VKRPGTKRSPRIKLTTKDAAELRQMKSGAAKLSARTWRRILTLEHLGAGLTITATAAAVGGYHREVGRVAKRYLERGLSAALKDEPRPGSKPLLDSVDEAAIVALVCGPPPSGFGRWTVRLLAAEVVKRGIVRRIGRETVREVMATHELKPWREKNVVRSGDQRRVRQTDGGRAPAVRAASGR